MKNTAFDAYGEVLAVGDTIVANTGGENSRGVILSMKDFRHGGRPLVSLEIEFEMTIAYGGAIVGTDRKKKKLSTCKIKDSRRVIKICGTQVA